MYLCISYICNYLSLCIIFSVLQHKDERRKKDEAILKQSHQLCAEVIEHNNYLHSLRVKTTIYGYVTFTTFFKQYFTLFELYG